MKLASALTERADIQRRLNTLSSRLNNNAKIQEGDTPAEDPEALLAEVSQLLETMEDLIARINLTNSRVTWEGQTLTQLLARRDCLDRKLQILRSFLDAASIRVQRMTRTEIKIVSTVDVAQLQKEHDRLAKELRLLDEKIQELNWTSELQ